MDSKKSPKGRRRTTKLASGQSSGLLDAAGSVGPPGVASTSTVPGLEGTVCQTSGSVVETGEYFWDCSVCTFRNHAEAFKCSMCDVRKGTSTRKPKLNPELVAAQQSQSITPPPSSCTPTPSTSTGGTCGVVDTDPAPLPGLLKMGKKGKDSSKMPIKKPKEAKKITGPPRLKNVDRSSATYHSVTVNDITVVITEFQPKLKKPKLKKLPTAAAATVTSSSSPLVSSGASPAAGSLLPASSTTSSGGLVKPSMGDCSLPLQLM